MSVKNIFRNREFQNALENDCLRMCPHLLPRIAVPIAP
jgi:hypothetical protein